MAIALKVTWIHWTDAFGARTMCYYYYIRQTFGPRALSELVQCGTFITSEILLELGPFGYRKFESELR